MQIDGGQIFNNDCLKVLASLPESSVDLIFADPPYFMQTSGKLLRTDGTQFAGCNDSWDKFTNLSEYDTFTYNWLKACKRVLKPKGSLWVIGSFQCIYSIGHIMQQLGYWIINDVIWYKTNPTPNFSGTRLNNSHETLLWAVKDRGGKFCFNYKTAKELNTDNVDLNEFKAGKRKQMQSVWRFAVCSGKERLKDDSGNKLHSTQKPLELLYRIIAISSKPGDTVLDPFAGTMTTGVAAKILGRKFIMIEKDSHYVSYGITRIQNTTSTIDDIALASFDKKPLKVSIEQMVNAGLLTNGEPLFDKTLSQVGCLCQDGKADVDSKKVSIHVLAGKSRGVARANAFDHLLVKRGDGYKTLGEVREQFRRGKNEL